MADLSIRLIHCLYKTKGRSTRMNQIWVLRSRALSAVWDRPPYLALKNSQLICGDVTIICETVH
jgi:hypothetical protein